MPKKKVVLEDLLEQPNKGRSNADLYKKDEYRRRIHMDKRSNRSNMMNPPGVEYRRPLASDIETDIKYHELAREFINNGLSKKKAWQAVYGCKRPNEKAFAIFNSIWFRKLVREMLIGEDGEVGLPDKEYAVQTLMRQIDANVLDYLDDDGEWLSVKELKGLPSYAQRLIKTLRVHTFEEPVTINEGQPNEREIMVRQQRVHIELWDKQKAMGHLARVMRWIESDKGGDINVILGSDVMAEAYQRIKQLRKDDENTIEGKVIKPASD